MTKNRKYTTITSFEVTMTEGVILQMSDGTERYFEIEEFTDFLELKMDLEEFSSDQGDWNDDGEGFHSPAMTIDWVAAVDHYSTLEVMNKFYNSHNNLILR